METWFAADCSGSVGGKAGQRYFAELRAAKAAAPADVYLLWDDTLAVVTEPAMHAWLLEERGHGGTDPSVLARRIRQQAFHGVLRLFTDGSVPSDKVAACDALLHGAALERGERGHVFERVEVYIVETGSAADLSVALPFTRFSPYELKHVPKEGLPPPPQRVSAADQALFDAFLAAEPLDVEAAAARLKEVAEARFMGTRGSPQVRDAAIAMASLDRVFDTETRHYLRDLNDHVSRVLDQVETDRFLANDLLDIYMTSVNLKLAETSKVLTIIATLFMPLTFIAGVYGMNFKGFFPELEWAYGYPYALALMIASAVVPMWYFRKRGWLK